MLNGKKVLLIITGGIAAYKSLELVRKLKEKGVDVIPVMTKAAENFVTPMSVSALAQEKVYTELFDLTDEAEMGHIELINWELRLFEGQKKEIGLRDITMYYLKILMVSELKLILSQVQGCLKKVKSSNLLETT